MMRTTVRYAAPSSACETCKKRDDCSYIKKHGKKCGGLGHLYKQDAEAVAKFDRAVRKKFDALVATLLNVKPEQLALFKRARGGAFDVMFEKLPQIERKRNAKNFSRKSTKKEYDEWAKHCEQCGAEFVTVNESRPICDECWDEICETLGVEYTNDVKE